MKVGQRNLITDVPGILVWHAADPVLKSGSTVLTSTAPFVAAVDVMGGAPGTRETDALAPDRLVNAVDALVLSGGSAYGLDAASGVSDALRTDGRGYAVGPAVVPIVPAAIIFDLLNGGDKAWTENPYRALGDQAYRNRSDTFPLGRVGAGFGALTASLQGGLGSASLVLDEGTTVGALVVANPHGDVVEPRTGSFWAAPFEIGDEYGAFGPVSAHDALATPQNHKMEAFEAAANTTIAIVATDARLDKAQLTRMAVAAQDGMARSIVPSHTPFDGDLIFSVSTSGRDVSDPATGPLHIGHAAAVCLSRAIARAIYEAQPEPGDTLPTWSQRWGAAKS